MSFHFLKMVPQLRFFRSFSAVFALALGAAGLSACQSTASSGAVAHVSSENALSDAELLEHPEWVLPSGGLFFVNVDWVRFRQVALASRLETALIEWLPLPESLSSEWFQPMTSVSAVAYATTGAEVIFLLDGGLDFDAIISRVKAGESTRWHGQIHEELFAGKTLVSAGSLGIAKLSKEKLVAGNLSIVRRALERAERGRRTSELPDWVIPQIFQGSSVANFGLSLDDQAIAEELSKKFPAGEGMLTLAATGDIEDKALRLAGTLHYRDSAAASHANEELATISAAVSAMSLVSFGASVSESFTSQEAAENLLVSAQIRESRLAILATLFAELGQTLQITQEK